MSAKITPSNRGGSSSFRSITKSIKMSERRENAEIVNGHSYSVINGNGKSTNMDDNYNDDNDISDNSNDENDDSYNSY